MDRKFPARGRAHMCQEASPLSRGEYVPCGEEAYNVVDNGDNQPYWMCDMCADHNTRNRGGVLLVPIGELMARNRADQTDEQVLKNLRIRATEKVGTFRYPITVNNREMMAILNRIDPVEEKPDEKDTADSGPVSPDGKPKSRK